MTMTESLITHAKLTNEGRRASGDVRICGGRIEHIDSSRRAEPGERVFDAVRRWLMPGMINDPVHLREPGLENKADIDSESRASLADDYRRCSERSRDSCHDSGHARERYFADLTVADPRKRQTVRRENALSKCGGSPFAGETFRSRIAATFVNSHLGHVDARVDDSTPGMRLGFAR